MSPALNKVLLVSLTLIGMLGMDARFAQADDHPQFSIDMENETSTVKKVNLCIDAINSRLVKKGIAISQVDELFKCKNRTRVPPAPLTSKLVIRIGNHFNWHLVFTFDSSGTVLSYYLTNCMPKHHVRDGLPYAEVKQKRHAQYEEADTEQKRLSLCVDMMSDDTIHYEMPASDIADIFGTYGLNKGSENGETIKTIPLSDKVDAWRFSYRCTQGRVSAYSLSNLVE